MTLRVVVTGPECTGKTTLAARLGATFHAPWQPEAARAYAEERAREGRELTVADVDCIAKRAIEAEDRLLANDPALLVLDTDLLSTVAYGRHYYGASSPWLEHEARARRAQLYLLCAPDIPWTPDGIRDRPEHRAEMFALFEGVLAEFGADVSVIQGEGDARSQIAIGAVTALVERS